MSERDRAKERVGMGERKRQKMGKNICIDLIEKYTFGGKRESEDEGGACEAERDGKKEEREREGEGKGGKYLY